MILILKTYLDSNKGGKVYYILVVFILLIEVVLDLLSK